MKGTYKFFGTQANIEDRVLLESLGQSVIMDEGAAKELAKGGFALIPAELFDSIGFTSQELVDFPSPGDIMSAPTSFLLKREKLVVVKQAWLDGTAIQGELLTEPE